MLQHLTRGIGLLEEAELKARREMEAMGRTLAEFREAVNKIHSINEQTWTSESHNLELTTAATIIENARMEWNSARLKFPLLAGAPPPAAEPAPASNRPVFPPETDVWELCKIGLALTWPLVLLGAGIFAALLWRR
jgi:hypothetical protein